MVETVAVLAVEVMVAWFTSEVGLKLPLKVPPASFNDNVSVMPLGTLLNVNRTCVLLGTAVLLFESCAAVRNADAKPSAMISEPTGSTILRLVKTDAVP